MNPRSPITLLCAALAAVALLAAPSTAAAAKSEPCWKELINDWYDGRIDKTYPAHCYREAQKHLPEDVRAYSSLEEDLERALASATRDGGPPNGNTPIDPLPDLGRNADPPAAGTDDPQTGAFGNDDKREAFLDNWAPANADSIPIPLLVLASLAMLLLLAAIGSYLARRVQARRVPVTSSSRTRTPEP